jgi:hypothetical protein
MAIKSFSGLRIRLEAHRARLVPLEETLYDIESYTRAKKELRRRLTELIDQAWESIG